MPIAWRRASAGIRIASPIARYEFERGAVDARRQLDTMNDDRIRRAYLGR
jgi:hypothetical protein